MSLIGRITPAVNVAIREAVANNIVVVTAAGNYVRTLVDFHHQVHQMLLMWEQYRKLKILTPEHQVNI